MCIIGQNHAKKGNKWFTSHNSQASGYRVVIHALTGSVAIMRCMRTKTSVFDVTYSFILVIKDFYMTCPFSIPND